MPDIDTEGIWDHVEDAIDRLWTALYDDAFLVIVNGLWNGLMGIFTATFLGHNPEYLLLVLIVCGIAWRFKSWG